jgi:hypothetical protein
VQIRATGSTTLAGFFGLIYSSYDVESGNLVDQSTSCLPVTATALEVENALETLALIDDVEVVRSGIIVILLYRNLLWSF